MSGGSQKMSEPAVSTALRPLAGTVVLGLGTLITHGFGLALTPAMLPRISEDLDAGYGVLGGAVAVGLVAYSIGALSTGRLLDWLPNRPALIASYSISAGGLLLAGAARSPETLAAGVVVTGFIAPVSWALTLHVAGVTTADNARGMVMAGASSGAALGVLINGVLVQTSESLHSWRVSFVIAAAIALIPITAGLLVYRRRIPHPSTEMVPEPGRLRRALTSRAGRVVVIASLMAGFAGFPFNTFLTATAIDELGISSLRTAAIWWVIGIGGVIAGPVFGRLGDRTSPLRAVLVGGVSCLSGLLILALLWNPFGLVVAAIGYTFMNYPIWGLVGSVANQQFSAGLAVRVISLGLIAGSLGGAAGSAIVGRWIDATESFRGPVIAMALFVAGVVAWLMMITRAGGLGDRNTSTQSTSTADVG